MKLSEQALLLEQKNEQLENENGILADENLRFRNMIDTMAEQLAKRPDTEYVAKLERLVELLTPEIMLLVANKETVVERFKEIPVLYRELRPKE
jgi:hypothetical protein